MSHAVAVACFHRLLLEDTDGEQAVSRAVELYGALHILMNHAGIMAQGSRRFRLQRTWLETMGY